MTWLVASIPQRRRNWIPASAVLALGLSQAVACLPRDRDVGRTRPTDAKNGERPAASGRRPTSAPSSAPKPAASAAPPAASDPLLSGVYTDDFEAPQLSSDWRPTSDVWRIEKGRLCGNGAHNHPIWLAKRLPVNARIEFDASSNSSDGDLKAEFWGDGSSFAAQTSYTNATSYLTIFGGWKNQFHVLARIDEHAANRPQIRVDRNATAFTQQPVIPDRTYRFNVERSDGKTVIWRVDGTEFLRYADDSPLVGTGHEHFGFNDWEALVCFDNLRITPLGG